MPIQNTLIIFNSNDLANNNVITFGDAKPVISTCYNEVISQTNSFSFDCGCINITQSNSASITCRTINYSCGLIWIDAPAGQAPFECICNTLWTDTNNFYISCVSSETTNNYINQSISYIGVSSSFIFEFDIGSISLSFGYSAANALYVSNMRLYVSYDVGYSSSGTLISSALLSSSYYIGYGSTANVLYNPFNPVTGVKPSYVGYELTNVFVFNPYHLFFANSSDYAVASFGNQLKNVFVFNPYHLFFANSSDYTAASFGNQLTNVFVFNPYHLFFANSSDYAVASFGNQLKNVFVFNPFNPLPLFDSLYFGIEAKSVIRYSDNPNISDDPIYYYSGFETAANIKFANNRADLSTTLYQGYTSNTITYLSYGFIGRNSLGYSSRAKNIITALVRANFINCISSFGASLHNNQWSPRYFDLSNQQCCTIDKYELRHVEMTRQDGWEVIYGLDKGWGIACTSTLTAQPRFKVTNTVGFESKVYDTSVYLGVVNIGFGLHARANSLTGQFNINIGYGNFITDQNGIKVEISKPLDQTDINYRLTYGQSAWCNFGASYAMAPTANYYGQYSYFALQVIEPIRGYFYAGYSSYFTLNANFSLYPNTSNFGYSVSMVSFYEAPYYFAYGFESTAPTLITENFVILLEEGELSNNYIFVTENGDPLLSRPHDGVSIEGYPYTHYVNGSCY